MIKNAIVQVLLKTVKSKNVVLIPSPILSLMASGRVNGLVVETGYLETKIIHIYDGRVLNPKCFAIGGSFLTSILKRKILENGKFENKSNGSEIVTPEWIESVELKKWENVKCKFLTFSQSDEDLHSKTLVRIPFGSEIILIEKRFLMQVSESLFELDSDDLNLAILIREMIKNSPIDIRKDLSQHIQITGGLACIPGFHSRLERMIKMEFEKDSSLKNLPIALLKSSFEPNVLSWTGGSIFGCIKNVSAKQQFSPVQHESTTLNSSLAI